MPKKITIVPPSTGDLWDPVKERFIPVPAGKPVTISIEHSLVAISKWEAKWKKHLLGNADINEEQFQDYVRCMTITQNVNPDLYYSLTEEQISDILDYMKDPMTATKITQNNQSGRASGSRFITSEVIYAQMAILRIPYSPCEKWHINRLLMLIQVTSIEQQPPKKMGKADSMARHKALNRARRGKR